MMTVIVISDLPNLAENSRQRPNTSEKIMAPKPVRRVSNHSGGAPATVETTTRSATVVEAIPRFKFVVPYHVREIGWMLGRAARWVISTVVIFLAGSALIYALFGKSTIDATLDDKPTKAQVWVNGDYVGDTPYTAYLGFDAMKIEILPPADVDVNEEKFTSEVDGMMYNIGAHITADFTTAE